MTKVALVCTTCGKRARRPLADQPGSRGVHETPAEVALCPDGHGAMVRLENARAGVVLDGATCACAGLPSCSPWRSTCCR